MPDTYHLAGHGRGTATFKFYEGRDILMKVVSALRLIFTGVIVTCSSLITGR